MEQKTERLWLSPGTQNAPSDDDGACGARAGPSESAPEAHPPSLGPTAAPPRLAGRDGRPLCTQLQEILGKEGPRARAVFREPATQDVACRSCTADDRSMNAAVHHPAGPLARKVQALAHRCSPGVDVGALAAGADITPSTHEVWIGVPTRCHNILHLARTQDATQLVVHPLHQRLLGVVLRPHCRLASGKTLQDVLHAPFRVRPHTHGKDLVPLHDPARYVGPQPPLVGGVPQLHQQLRDGAHAKPAEGRRLLGRQRRLKAEGARAQLLLQRAHGGRDDGRGAVVAAAVRHEEHDPLLGMLNGGHGRRQPHIQALR
mmetsp:Transcript_17572/g.61424  ORF Transcript_17572/g.61424 Transcript_17572/m.61424 type:complete len:317 (-) Transcript_17572:613-1563(-)